MASIKGGFRSMCPHVLSRVLKFELQMFALISSSSHVISKQTHFTAVGLQLFVRAFE